MLAVAVQEAPGHVKPKIAVRYETKAPQPSAGYRRDHFLSLVFLPLLTGIGHLAPSVGAARAMLGHWYLDWPVLVATSTITAFIDGEHSPNCRL
jgi:hypothetical protein